MTTSAGFCTDARQCKYPPVECSLIGEVGQPLSHDPPAEGRGDHKSEDDAVDETHVQHPDNLAGLCAAHFPDSDFFSPALDDKCHKDNQSQVGNDKA